MTDESGFQDAVTIERNFDAPVDLIWQMWTDPDHFKAWYGPDGAIIPVAKMDVHVGGTRLVCMEVQSPDGPMQMWFTGEYREIVENERIVQTEVFEGMPEAGAVDTIAFVELDGGRTRMEMLVQHEKPEHRDAHINSGMEGGMQESMDLLEEVARSLA